MNIKYVIIPLFLLIWPASLKAQVKPFIFQQITIKPGSKASFSIAVSDGKNSTVIPISVFHGQEKGPVLGIIAGVHGYEYPPIIAAQKFAQSLDPAKLKGTVILVHLANVPAFLKRSIQYNPQDGKNLNRVFPGSPDGTITERLAWTISNEIIARCNYVIDVHSGDGNNDLMPYSGYYNYTSLPELSKKGRAMAAALSFPYVIKFGNEASITEASIYCSREAIKRNTPAVDIECGRFGMAEPEYVARIQTALNNLLVHLQITTGKLQQQHPIYIGKRSTVDSDFTGFFYGEVKAGEKVKKGTKLGHLTDLFGKHLADVFSPVNGIILYMTSTPPISKGEGLFSIGHLE